MPTLLVANIQTGSATTDLTLRTGNTSGPSVILYSNNSGIAITSNSTNVLLSINATSNVFLGGVAVGGSSSNVTTANVSGTGQLITSGNVTPTIITSNTTAWNPDSTAVATVIRVQANAAGTANNTNLYEAYISGLVAGTNGEIYTISNIGAQKIQLRNEDSVNETTAGNRFSLPNHVWLYGYQSIQMIYDGIKSRWTPLNCIGASPSLSLGYDYDNTVTLRTDYKSQLTKGFFAGGYIAPASSATSEKITYATESRSTLSSSSNTLSVARWHLGGVAGNVDKGFFSGGYTGAAFSLITDKVTVTTEQITAVSGANLSQAREGPGAAGNIDKGIFAGGATAIGSTTPVTTADRTTYASETTAAVSGANLSQARGLLIAVGNADKGFFMGGFVAPASVTTAGRTTYSTETHAAVAGANLSQARRDLAAAGNSDKGFVAGGDNPVGLTTTDRATYSTETTAAVSGANLSQARSGAGGAGNSDKGFFAGGITPTPASVVTADRTTYASETTAAVSGANLGTAKHQLAAV